jgi:hypothetical protein
VKRWQLLLLGIVGGVGLGLLIGWILLPVRYYDTTPANLSAVYRDEYVHLVAQTFAVDGDIHAAQVRLAQLDVEEPLTAVRARHRRLVEDAPESPTVAALEALIAALETAPPLATPTEKAGNP